MYPMDVNHKSDSDSLWASSCLFHLCPPRLPKTFLHLQGRTRRQNRRISKGGRSPLAKLSVAPHHEPATWAEALMGELGSPDPSGLSSECVGE